MSGLSGTPCVIDVVHIDSKVSMLKLVNKICVDAFGVM